MQLIFRYLWVLFIASTPLTAFIDSIWAADFFSPRTAALGGAGHAGPILNDSIYLNPSFNSFLQSYSISFNYLSYSGGDPLPDGSSTIHGINKNISLQDGRSEFFQAGVGYTQRGDVNLLSIGASKAILQQLGIGLGGKFLFPHDDNSPVVRDSILSTTFIPMDWLQLALIVDNLFETDDGKSRGLYREFILAGKVNIQNLLLIYFDPHWVPTLTDKTIGHELGIEIGLFQDLFLRFGNFTNSAVPFQYGARGRGYGVGAGWIGPRISLDYAISRVIEPSAEVAHVFGATIYF